jgi:hypothetical protein
MMPKLKDEQARVTVFIEPGNPRCTLQIVGDKVTATAELLPSEALLVANGLIGAADEVGKQAVPVNEAN